MAALQLPAIGPFSVLSDTATLSKLWAKWVKTFEYFLVASNVTDKKRQRALLLHLAGPEVQEVFETLTETGDDYDTALAKLDAISDLRRKAKMKQHSDERNRSTPSNVV